MSRIRMYGRSVAVLTSGPDAVPAGERGSTVSHARKMLGQNALETFKTLRVVGVEIDPDTFDVATKVEDDRIVISWTAQGRQTRGLLARIRWAVGL